ncbi:MAG: hypothetical protein Fur0041_08020 [Bacteroidia bacterium]
MKDIYLITDNARTAGSAINRQMSFAEKWRLVSAAGLTSLTIPESHEGPDLNAAQISQVLSAFAEHCPDARFAFALGAHLLAGLYPLRFILSEPLKKHVYNAVLHNGYVLANAITESTSGNNVFAMQTSAVSENDHYILSGSKTFCTNAQFADGIVVYALTNPTKGMMGGVSCFLAERSKNHFITGGEAETVFGNVYFNESHLPAENLIGKAGSGTKLFLDSMNLERACLAALHCGTMKRIIKQTVQHVKQRHNGTQLLSEYQAVQFRIAEMETQLEASRLISAKAAIAFDTKTNEDLYCAMAKVTTSEALDHVCRNALILYGASGLENLMPDVTAAQESQLYSGSNDVLRNLIASRL